MFEGFEPFCITTQQDPQVVIRGLQHVNSSSSNDLPALLLLHGAPQTRHIWHEVAPQLVGRYKIVIPDLRGYGQSSKPDKVDQYAKSVMARDFAVLMEQLGFNKFFVCAHDRGARVAHKLCADYPDRVRKAMFLDICPTLCMYESTDMVFAKAYWHWFFLIQDEPLPETFLAADPRKWAELFMGGRQLGGLGIFKEECFNAYVEALEDPATIHGICQDYRASATLDLDESRDDLSKGRLIKCPIRILWGKHGVIEKCFDALKEWRAVTEPGVSVDGHAVESGHYIPEVVPNEVVSNIVEFLK